MNEQSQHIKLIKVNTSFFKCSGTHQLSSNRRIDYRNTIGRAEFLSKLTGN